MNTMTTTGPSTTVLMPKAFCELHFMVVEDHPLQRQMLMLALRNLGASHISEAADGHQALTLIRDTDTPVNIVVCDLDMPNMDGMAFIRHVGEYSHQPSLIVTSALEPGLLASVDTMAKAYGIRLLGTIEKPATPERLLHTIVKHDGEDRTLSSSGSTILSLEDIKSALEEDRFVAYFQPKVSLPAGSLAGAEALARLRHPQLGIVPPSAFISLMESEGLIDRLTWAMLLQSATACAEWQRRGIQITVSVNLSLVSLGDPALADRITELVRDQQLDPRMMVLEITESAAMTDIGPALENLARLRMKGFGLSIDDFGTGYSSMQQLSRIPFTELKIDRSFVADAGNNQQRRIMLESSNNLAQKLGLKAVAEGVETREELQQLEQIGCAIAQGYFIARPMPAAEFLDWALKWRPESLLR